MRTEIVYVLALGSGAGKVTVYGYWRTEEQAWAKVPVYGGEVVTMPLAVAQLLALEER